MWSIQNFAKVLEREFSVYVAFSFQTGVRKESYWREGEKIGREGREGEAGKHSPNHANQACKIFGGKITTTF